MRILIDPPLANVKFSQQGRILKELLKTGKKDFRIFILNNIKHNNYDNYNF